MKNNESPYLLKLERIKALGYLDGIHDDYTYQFVSRYEEGSNDLKLLMDQDPNKYLSQLMNGTFQANQSLRALISIKKNVQFLTWLIIISLCAYVVVLLLAQKSF